MRGAKVSEWVVTPRAGKAVEVQALWLNALWIASRHNDRWKESLQRGLDSFQARFWNAERKMLYDAIYGTDLCRQNVSILMHMTFSGGYR